MLFFKGLSKLNLFLFFFITSFAANADEVVLGGTAAGNVGKNFLSNELNSKGQIIGFPQKSGTIAYRSNGNPSKLCLDKVQNNGWNLGINQPGDINEFLISIGSAEISVKPGDESFIEQRQVAFKEALLNAKKELADSLRSHAIRNVVNDIAITNSIEPQRSKSSNDKDALSPSKKSVTSTEAYPTTNPLVAQINQALLTRVGAIQNQEIINPKNYVYDPDKLTNSKLDLRESVKRIIEQEQLQPAIAAVALSHLRGIYTPFIGEVASVEERPSICVVARYSRSFEALADAMASRQFFNVKKLVPNQDILASIPDPNDNNGLFELVSLFGVTVIIDQNGDPNIIAFGQASLTSESDIQKNSAIEKARLNAVGSIRQFINTVSEFKRRAESVSDIDSLTKMLDETEIFRIPGDYYLSSSGFLPINGIFYPIPEWIAPHPVSGQTIVGTVAAWNATRAAAALRVKERVYNAAHNKQSQMKNHTNPEKKTSNKISNGGQLEGSTRSFDY
ncbi:MAG: hypothetical protein VW124_09855 [Paracoccaceae bacterium]